VTRALLLGAAAAILAASPAAALAAPASAPASAPNRARVVLVSMTKCCADEAWPEAEEAARAELAGIGIDVVLVQSWALGERERRLELRRLAAERNADSALRIVRPIEERAAGGVEVWLEDRVTERTMVRHLRVAPHGGDEGALVAALKAVEAVRAIVLELALARGDPRAPREATRTVRLDAPNLTAVVGVRVGGGIVGGPGGVDPLGALAVAVRWELRWPLTLEGHGLVSLGGSDVGTGGSRATFNVALLRALALWTPGRAWRLRPALGVGVGVAVPWATAASAASPATSDRAAVAWLGGTARLRLRLSRLLALQLEGHAGALVPEVRVRFRDAVGARFGRPLLDALLAVEIGLR
jgi:hypothetical protein